MWQLPAELPEQSSGASPLPDVAKESAADGRPGSPVSQAKTRTLSYEEIGEKNEQAVQWFRASRAINRNVRSIEETEELLVKARHRRASGIKLRDAKKTSGAEQTAAKVESKRHTLTSEPEIKPNPVKPPENAAPGRRTVDPMALWAKPQTRNAPPPPQLAKPKECSFMRGSVTVGDQGENGLLARLRRKKSEQ